MTPSASTTTSPFVGASIGIALLISTAESFSIRKSHVPTIHQKVNAGNTGLQARQWKTSLPYLNYENIDFGGEPSTTNNLEQMTKFALVPETHQRLEESMQDGWGGLNEIYSSPSAFSLGWSFFVPNGVSASFLDTKQKESSPLVLTPATAADTTSEFLRSFLQINQKWVDERILEYGGIVFRGFGGTTGSEASAAIGKEILRAFGPGSGNNKFEYYMVSDDDDEKDSHTKPLPSVEQRAQTVSTRGSNPSRISEISAHTRLTDWRGIHDALPVKLVKKLHDKQLLYKHTHLVPASRVSPEFLLSFRQTIPATQPSSWSRLFGSTNKKAFERAYRKLHGERAFSIEESKFVCDAFRCHPLTNEKIWFELAHKLHWTSLPAELFSDFARTKNPLALARAIRAASISLWKRLRPRTIRQHQQRQQKPTTTVAFGDGTPVSWWEMHQIRRAIRQNTARHPWKHGDFLVVDGLSMGLQN